MVENIRLTVRAMSEVSDNFTLVQFRDLQGAKNIKAENALTSKKIDQF